jgi:hypothetical protein
MSEAQQWREHVAQLRALAERAQDSERQRRLRALASEWEELANELESAPQADSARVA